MRAENRIQNEDDFDQAWARLAELGQCDGPGGAEYRRVRSEWEQAGQPPWLDQFIVVAANRPSIGPGREAMN